MRFLYYQALLLGLFDFANGSSFPHIKREITQPGRKTSEYRAFKANSLLLNAFPVRGNVSEIISWTATALSYTAINTVSYQPTNLTYLCDNFGNLTARYKEAFPEIQNGDVTAFANETICSAAQVGTGGSPSDNAWSLRSYISAIFILQTYAGNPQPKNEVNYSSLSLPLFRLRNCS
jgi:hypothetical protein